MKFFRYILFISISLSLFACSDDVCNEDTDTLLSAEFVVKDNALKAIGFVDSSFIYSTEWIDSIYYIEEGSDNTLNLMLSPYSDTSEFIVSSKNAEFNDTFTVVAQRELQFLSKECGFITKYFIDTVFFSYNYIDSIDITNEEITTSKNGQIQIYF